MFNVTVQTIVKNEENWVWFSLVSVKDLVKSIIVYDDNSTDKTKKIVESIKDPKIYLKSVKTNSPSDLTEFRNEMLKKTKTDWFVLLDGDEVWNSTTFKGFLKFLEKQPKDIYAVALHTRNCVGDIYHYLPEEAGEYEILGRKGHLNIRAYRKLPGFHWKGGYPLESYVDEKGGSINSQDKHLAFFDDFYWHMTHLARSSSREKVLGWRKVKLEAGIKVKDSGQFPKVFNLVRPEIVPDPWIKVGPLQKIYSFALTPFKKLRRRLK